MMISLLDDNDTIHSQEQILYIPTRDCRNKSNIYLLYRSRPKNIAKKYNVRVDAYKNQDLTYYVSWILPISFIFMPVNRIAVDLIIPSFTITSARNYTLFCGIHGQCRQSVNTKEVFCHCHSGWSGKYCFIPYKRNCSSHAICVGPTTCLCSLHKRGPRYFLNSTCHINPCKNEALCIPNNQQLLEDRFSCICPEGFSGELCEIADFRIDISFANNIPIPQLLTVHLITTRQNNTPLLTSFVRKIPFDQNFATYYINFLFHLLFAAIDDNYYLVLMQETPNISVVHVVKQLKTSDRCPSVQELFDIRTANYPRLRRLKYYHIPCRQRMDLACFRDNNASLMCIFNRERHATYDCQYLNGCENEGKCFRGRLCPMSVACICSECYYGTRCQFSTKGTGFSLDTILGYEIRRDISIVQQPASIKVSIAIMVIMLLASIFNGTLSIMTFQSKKNS